MHFIIVVKAEVPTSSSPACVRTNKYNLTTLLITVVNVIHQLTFHKLLCLSLAKRLLSSIVNVIANILNIEIQPSPPFLERVVSLYHTMTVNIDTLLLL